MAAIDFSDPAQVTHQGKHIPIDTQEKYDSGLTMMKSFHEHYACPFDADAEQQYEQRVRNGEDIIEIQRHFVEDMKARYNIEVEL